LRQIPDAVTCALSGTKPEEDCVVVWNCVKHGMESFVQDEQLNMLETNDE